MSTPGSYRYSWSSGRYYNDQGNEVTYGEVFVNYIAPNSVDAPYSLFVPGFGARNEGSHNKRPNSKPVTQRTLAAAIQGVILSKASMMFGGTIEDIITSEILCYVFHQSFNKYYHDFLNQMTVYMGIDDIEQIASWIMEISVLYPDEKYLEIYPELKHTSAIINWLRVEGPDGVKNIGSLEFLKDQYGNVIRPAKEFYPYFSYRPSSTINPALYKSYDPIPLRVDQHNYTFFMQWQIISYYSYNF